MSTPATVPAVPPSAPTIDATTVERVLLHGDLSKLTPAQKISYYRAVCDSVGLNPLTQPFQYLVLNGREVLYALRAATEQLRQIHQVSITITGREVLEDCYVVTARATLPTGRQDENIGVVPIANLKGEARANAMMKAETKAKRRATLAICGLGMLDETEVESIPSSGATLSVSRVLTPDGEFTPPVPPGDEEPLPEGFVRVMRVESKPTKNPKVIRYTITFSTGESATTINAWLASKAERAQAARTPVQPVTKSTQFGVELSDLGDEGASLGPPTPPDEPLPF